MQTSYETFSLHSSQIKNNDLFVVAGEITDVGYLKVQQKLNKHYCELQYDSYTIRPEPQPYKLAS